MSGTDASVGLDSAVRTALIDCAHQG